MNALRGNIKISLSHSEHGPSSVIFLLLIMPSLKVFRILYARFLMLLIGAVDVEVEVDIFKSKTYAIRFVCVNIKYSQISFHNKISLYLACYILYPFMTKKTNFR